MNILITGGVGGVGRPLVQRLLAHGHSVRILDRKPDQQFEGAECVTGDVTDFAAVRQHVRGMDAIVHLAALTYPAAGPAHEIYRINCSGTFNVYEAAAQEGIRRVVAASSINALGFNFGVKPFSIEYLPLDEAHPTYTTDVYSFSKQSVEDTAAYYWRRDGISGVQLRMPFVYGGEGFMPNFRDMLRRIMADTRVAYHKLMEQGEAEQAAVAQRVIEHKNHERAERLSEVPWDQRRRTPPDQQPQFDPLMSMFAAYTDFWAILSGKDAAQAFEKGLTADYDGSHPLYVCEKLNSLDVPSATLARMFFPEAKLTRPLHGSESLVSYDRARTLLGYEPEHSVAEWLAD